MVCSKCGQVNAFSWFNDNPFSVQNAQFLFCLLKTLEIHRLGLKMQQLDYQFFPNYQQKIVFDQKLNYLLQHLSFLFENSFLFAEISFFFVENATVFITINLLRFKMKFFVENSTVEPDRKCNYLVKSFSTLQKVFSCFCSRFIILI